MTNLPACCLDLELDPLLIIFPERLDADGWEFVTAHGLDAMTLADLQRRSTLMENGKVRIQHRCAQLRDDGLCGIYETRPAICRAFDCRTRVDCACKGAGFIAVGDVVFESDIA
jgi:Fe-S-cluster containining protein